MWEAGWFSKAGNGPFTVTAQSLGLSEQNFFINTTNNRKEI